jgi:hypothetical protein
MIVRPRLNQVRPVEGALQGSAKPKGSRTLKRRAQSGLLGAGRPNASAGWNECNLEAS